MVVVSRLHHPLVLAAHIIVVLIDMHLHVLAVVDSVAAMMIPLQSVNHQNDIDFFGLEFKSFLEKKKEN